MMKAEGKVKFRHKWVLEGCKMNEETHYQCSKCGLIKRYSQLSDEYLYYSQFNDNPLIRKPKCISDIEQLKSEIK